MNGVEILSSEIIYVTEYDSWPFWVMGAIVTAIAAIVFVYNIYQSDAFDSFMCALAALAFGAMILIIPTVIIAEHKTDEVFETRYKVTISEEVSMIEFYEKYEVIDQEGKIFTIRERDLEE